jgi:hypothetical protein
VQHFPLESCLHHRPVGLQRNHLANADGNQAASREVVKEAAAAKAPTNIGRIRKLCT